MAIGRSGTTFLSNLLNKNDDNVEVFHEPCTFDRISHQRAFHDSDESIEYMKNFRMKGIEYYIKAKKLSGYGEVNSFLRRHIIAIQKFYPYVKLFHLVRDGRDVVRSMLSNDTMEFWDENTKYISPNEHDVFYSKWNSMNRFERLCWYWMVENEYLSTYIKEYIKFEDLLEDYNYFDEKVLRVLGLNVTKEKWEIAKESPKNVTDHDAPKWETWDDDIKRIFWKICGGTMLRYGYDVPDDWKNKERYKGDYSKRMKFINDILRSKDR